MISGIGPLAVALNSKLMSTPVRSYPFRVLGMVMCWRYHTASLPDFEPTFAMGQEWSSSVGDSPCGMSPSCTCHSPSGSVLSCTRQLTVSCCFASSDATVHSLFAGALHCAKRVEAVTASAVRQSTRWIRLIRNFASLEDCHNAASTVCNLQQGMSSTVVLNLLHTMYVTDAWNLAEVLLKAREMAQVNGFDDEVDVDGAVGGGSCLDAANVGSVFGNDGGE